MKRRAMADLQLLPAVYYDLQPAELSALLAGHRERILENRRLMRLPLTMLWNVNVDKKDRKTPAELLPLPGDDEQEGRDRPLPPAAMIQQLNAVFGGQNNSPSWNAD